MFGTWLEFIRIWIMVHVADIHLPAAGDDGDKCPDDGQMTEREEVKESVEMAEVSNGATESVSFDRNKGTGIIENVSVGSAGVDTICNVEDQDNGAGVGQGKPLNDQECNEESSQTCGYLSDEKQKEDEREMMKDEEEEEEGGKAEAEDLEKKKRRLMSEEAQLEERAEDQTCGNAEKDDVRQGRADVYQDLKPEASDRDATRDLLIEKDEVREVEMVGDGGNEGLEKNKYVDSHAESQDKEDSHDVRQTLNEDEGDEQEVCDLRLVSSDKKEDEEEMEVDDSEGKTGANKLTSEPEYLTKSPHCGSVTGSDQSPPLAIVDKQAADEKTRTDYKEDKGGKTGTLELLTKNEVDLQGCEDMAGVGAGEQGGSSRLFERSEQQKDERRDDKGDKEQKREKDEAAQGSTTKPDCSEDVEDQDEGGFDDGGQNGPEQTIGVHEDVGAEEPAKENKDPSQSGTEELRENQGGEGVEKMENSQPKERDGQDNAIRDDNWGGDQGNI